MLSRQNKIAEHIYLLGISAAAIKALFNFSNLIPIFNLEQHYRIMSVMFDVVFILCMVYKLLFFSTIKSKFVAICALGLLCIYTYAHINYYYLFITFFSVVAISDIDIGQICKRLISINTTFLIVHVLLYISYAVIDPSVISYNYRGSSDIPRINFLMGHANTFTMYLTWTCLMFIYVNQGRLSKNKLIGIWLINLVFYFFTDSTTGIIVMTMVTLVTLLKRKNPIFGHQVINRVSKFGFLTCSIVFPLIVVMYEHYNGTFRLIFNSLNEFFTGRLLYGAALYDMFGSTMLGQPVSLEEKKVFWNGFWFDGLACDNTYIWMFVSYGYLYLILISIGFIMISKRLTDFEKLMIIAFTFYGIMEAYIINAVFCFPILLIGKYIFERDGSKGGLANGSGDAGRTNRMA